MVRALLVVGLFGLATEAHASSVAGCRYEAEVKAVADAAGEITLDLSVLTSDPFGHSGPPPTCTEVGGALSFAPDDDKDVRVAAVAMGDRVRVESTEVWNGRKHFTQHDFLEKLPPPAATEPAPTEPAPAEPVPTEPAPTEP